MPSKDEGITLYKINPKAKSTVLLYNKKAVTAKFVDYNAKRDNAEFTKQIEKTWTK